MQNHPVRQHWIPKTYLRSFCAQPVEAEQIYARDLELGREFRTSISNVAVMRHLYTIDVQTDTPSYAIENALCSIEGAFTPILERITLSEELSLTDSERQIFARFLATLQMRTRQGLAVIKGFRDDVRLNIDSPDAKLSRKHAESLIELDHEGLREFFAKAVVSIAPAIADVLLGMNWRLIRTEDAHFITSENPFLVHHSAGERWGLGTPGAHIQVPLTPRLLLHIAGEPIIPGTGTFDLSSEGANALNGLTLVAAEQYLFSSEPFDKIRSLINERSAGVRREFGPESDANARPGRT